MATSVQVKMWRATLNRSVKDEDAENVLSCTAVNTGTRPLARLRMRIAMRGRAGGLESTPWEREAMKKASDVLVF